MSASTRIVGTTPVRMATVVLAALSAGLAAGAPSGPRILFYSALAAGFLAFIALVHSFRGLFARWMRFATTLLAVVVTTMFSACYLLVVPIFGLLVWMRDPLRLRPAARRRSSWVRREAGIDPLSLERMG